MVNSTFELQAPSTVFLNSSVPLYVQVADRLRQRISSGVWVAGQLIPSLDGIAEEFGVARVTARQAVQLLSEEKLVLARRGIGTVVSQGVHTPRVVNLQTSLTDLAAMYESTHTEVLTFDEGSRKPPVSQEEGRLGESYVHMQRLHFTDGQPYAVISLYLLHSVFRADPEAFRSHAVIPLLVKMNVIERAHQTMQIGAAEAETARLLRVGAGAPVARVSRIFHTQGDLILYCAQVIYRGDWVRWDMDLKPQP